MNPIVDLKTQQQLLCTQIPQKRTFNKKQRLTSTAADDAGDSDDQIFTDADKTNKTAEQVLERKGVNANGDSDSDYGAEDDRQRTEEDYAEMSARKRLNNGMGGMPMMSDPTSSGFPDITQSLLNASEAGKHLPIAKHKHLILQKLEQSKCLIISGDTGCGKTTQVPKYILENQFYQGKPVKIICTQPRRLAAVSIAKRVAAELGERVGRTVGYQVGMQRCVTKGLTKIVFMTTGIFLMRLVNNPQSLARYTHLIMDEVHERDLDIDFSLVVVKHLLSRQGRTDVSDDADLTFKLILMSATFNFSLFANYFSRGSVRDIEMVNAYKGVEENYELEEKLRMERDAKEWGSSEVWGNDKNQASAVFTFNNKSKTGSTHKAITAAWGQETKNEKEAFEDDEWVETKMPNQMKMPVKQANDPAEVIEINARCFDVKELYLDELIQNVKKDVDRIKVTKQDLDLFAEVNAYIQSGQLKPAVRECEMRVASIIVCDVIERLNAFDEEVTEKQSVLIFLPGLAEIMQFMDYMYEYYDRQWLKSTFDLIPLHSSLNEDEQDRAFRPFSQDKEKRRKVIVATNIAESSITIPDVKYVIDFMLTKELHYDPVSRSESLQLVWSSKASAKQRMGRTGRVSNGFVFRMVAKKFYVNSVPDYPVPEMQRCPLEKLILQIKMWNRYEPEEILGRAIQPPELRDIFNATKNLQQTGALTIPPRILQKDGSLAKQEEHKPRITALGKIFVNLPVDLKITRLFLFGMALKCMSQAIQIGCIHAQARSIFKRGARIDQVEQCKMQCIYDEQRDSDSLLLLRVYQEWIHKFHPYLKHKKGNEDEGETGGAGRPGGFGRGDRPGFNHKGGYGPNAHGGYGASRNQADSIRLFIKRPMVQEKKWCNDHNLDCNVLRDVAQLVEEVRNRFIRINISPQCLNSKVYLGREDSPDAELILKICIGGAFYNKYVKAAYKNQDQLSRAQSNPMFNIEEGSRTIILNKISEHIKEQHLKQFFEAKFKVKVHKIQLSQDKPMIVFGPEILEKGYLKACFRLGLNKNRISRFKKLEEDEYEASQQFRSSIMTDTRQKNKNVVLSYDDAREMLESDEVRRPHYLFELRFETMNKESFVDFDLDSINNFTSCLDPLKVDQVTFACQDFYDKAGRFLCRNSTRLPDVPMVDVLFCLIFAPLVQVMSDESKRYFSRIVCDQGEQVLPLTHILTHQDLELAQHIRNLLNETLCDADKQKQAHLAQVDFYMKKLFSMQRISVDIYVKLDLLRQEDENELQQKEFLKQLKVREELEENFFFDDEAHGNEKGFEDVQMDQESGDILSDRQARYEADCKRGYFLQPIFVQQVNKKIYFYNEMVADMMSEFRGRILAKREKIDQIRRRCKEYSIKDTMVICERCRQDLAPLKTLDYQSDELHFAKCVFGTFKPIPPEQALQTASDADRDFVDLYLDLIKDENAELANQNKPPIDFQFCSCNQGHIVGIIKNQRYFLTELSPVMLMFPSAQYHHWEAKFWGGKGYPLAFNEERKLNALRLQTRHPQWQKSSVGKNGRQNNASQLATPMNNNVGDIGDGKLQQIMCELCQFKCADPDVFIQHCKTDKTHKELEQKFTDETYDFLFEDQNIQDQVMQ